MAVRHRVWIDGHGCCKGRSVDCRLATDAAWTACQVPGWVNALTPSLAFSRSSAIGQEGPGRVDGPLALVVSGARGERAEMYTTSIDYRMK